MHQGAKLNFGHYIYIYSMYFFEVACHMVDQLSNSCVMKPLFSCLEFLVNVDYYFSFFGTLPLLMCGRYE
jgi:hypothetical protein